MPIIKKSKDGTKIQRWNQRDIDEWPISSKPTIDQLRNSFKSVLVMGAAPGAKSEYIRCSFMYHIDCSIAVNYHFTPYMLFDFAAFLDKPELSKERSGIDVPFIWNSFNGRRLSIHPEWTDVWITNDDALVAGDSGVFAIDLACQLTKGRVFICGFNNRTPGGLMYDENSFIAKTRGNRVTTSEDCNWARWRELMSRIENKERLVFMNKDFENSLRDNHVII